MEIKKDRPQERPIKNHPVVGDLVMVEVEGEVYKLINVVGGMAQLRRAVKAGLPGTLTNEQGGGVFRWVDVADLKLFRRGKPDA